MRYTLSGYHGIILNGPDVGLDLARNEARYLFVSHAHADHLPREQRIHVYASPATAELMRLRGFRGEITPLEFETPLELDTCTVTLYPAGHILGSAMILVECDEGRILYSGDYKTPPSPASEGFKCPEKIDYFITEATFSLPLYEWRTHDELFQEIRGFAESTLKEYETPVFLCYNLGKAQEVMHALAPLGHPVQIHGAGYPLCSIYEKFGIDLGKYEAYDKNTVQDGRILIAPSSALEQPMIRNIRRKKTAYVSGWAALEARRSQLIIDKQIPLSDHIDFFELIELCRKMNPKKVFITHTPNPNVVMHFLEGAGIAAQPLNMEAHHED